MRRQPREKDGMSKIGKEEDGMIKLGQFKNDYLGGEFVVVLKIDARSVLLHSVAGESTRTMPLEGFIHYYRTGRYKPHSQVDCMQPDELEEYL